MIRYLWFEINLVGNCRENAIEIYFETIFHPDSGQWRIQLKSLRNPSSDLNFDVKIRILKGEQTYVYVNEKIIVTLRCFTKNNTLEIYVDLT